MKEPPERIVLISYGLMEGSYPYNVREEENEPEV
jgi:hypothetical protein